MRAVQMDCERVPDRFAFRRHRGLEQFVLKVARQAAPAMNDGLTKRPGEPVGGLG